MLIVDMHADVMNELWDAARVRENVSRILARARAGNVPVIRVQHSDEQLAYGSPEWEWVQGLYDRNALAKDAGVSPKGSGFAGIALAHNVESEVAVDAVMQQAVAAGAKVTRPAQKMFWGGYSGYFSDPDGYLWEVAHNPCVSIGPQNQDG